MQHDSTPIRLERIHEMTAGDPEFLREIVDMYIEDADGILGELGGALSRRDPERLRFHAHRLKGSSLNMGVGRMAELAKALEDFGKADECGPSALETFESLSKEMQVTREAFAALLAEAA